MSAAFLFGFFDRWLHLAADGGPTADGPAAADRLRAFRLLLMVHAPVELLRNTLVMKHPFSYFGACFTVGLVLCLGLSFVPGRERLGASLYVGFLLGLNAWLFPAISNHSFIILFALGLLALLDLEEPREALLGLHACRWLPVVVLFYSGLQKVFYGSYFHGQYLTWTIAHDPRFSWAFGWAIPQPELDRIRALANTTGPFSTDWLPLVLVSNSVYLLELGLPLLLLWRRTRAFALAATIALLVAIEAGARELLFGIVFVNALLLFARRNWNRTLLPLFFAFYAFVLIERLGRTLGWSCS